MCFRVRVGVCLRVRVGVCLRVGVCPRVRVRVGVCLRVRVGLCLKVRLNFQKSSVAVLPIKATKSKKFKPEKHCFSSVSRP